MFGLWSPTNKPNLFESSLLLQKKHLSISRQKITINNIIYVMTDNPKDFQTSNIVNIDLVPSTKKTRHS